jgi:hypothetical protein
MTAMQLSRSIRRRACALGALLAGALLLAGCPWSLPPDPNKPPVLDAACRGVLAASTPGSVASASVVELSGISASRRNADVWWVHNDSGDSARVFAVGNDGRDLGTYSLSAASAFDWEDIAVGPGPAVGTHYIYAADIGDNARARASVTVYRVAEPAVDAAAPTPPPQSLTGVAALTLTYPDAPHDAEALLVDPSTGDLFIVTKEGSGTSQVFRAPANLAAGSSTAMTQVATVALGAGQLVTAADVTPDGDVVGLRTYGAVTLFKRTAGTPLGQAFSGVKCAGKTTSEAQGEAIGFTHNGRGYVTASEGAHPALHRFVAP